MNHQERIDTDLDDNTTTEVIDLNAQMLAKLPFLLHLSTAEKKRLAKPRAGLNEVADGLVEIQTESGLAVASDDQMLADAGGRNPDVTDVTSVARVHGRSAGLRSTSPKTRSRG